MSILRIKNLTKDFDGIKAVDDVSLEIEKNSIVALIGPNGSGKTTIINLLSGFLKPNRGNVFLDGEEITAYAPHKIAQLGIGRTFQNIRLFAQLSVLDNVLLSMRYGKEENFFSALFQTKEMRKKDEANRQRAEKILAYVGLKEKQDELAENLSHGQRRLLEIGRLLALEPRIFLLDEPTAGLFPEVKKKILDLLKDLRQKGNTIVFIEHDMNFVMNLAEKIVVLDAGRKIAEGGPQEIKANKEVLKSYLGSMAL